MAEDYWSDCQQRRALQRAKSLEQADHRKVERLLQERCPSDQFVCSTEDCFLEPTKYMIYTIYIYNYIYMYSDL